MSDIIMNGNKTVLRVSDGQCVSEVSLVGGNVYISASKIDVAEDN